MEVQIFRGNGRVFAFTKDSGPDNLPTRYGPWTVFKSLTMTRGCAQPGVNVDECLNDIDRHGLHITDAHIRITDQAIS